MLGSRLRWSTVLLSLVLTTAVLYYVRSNSDGMPLIFRDRPPKERPFGAVVAAARDGDDLTWMQNDLFSARWTIFPYNINDTSKQGLELPSNKGHEAMVYLSYIIDHYDSLPWMVVFTHGHLEGWHQEYPVDWLINTLKRDALAREGYISLRCDWYPSCPAEIRPWDHDGIVWGPGIKREETENAIAGNWRLILPGESMPETISSQCCAQFAVTRRAIRRRPKKDYERMRTWLIGSLLEDDVSGRVFEKLWAYIFTGKPVHCPPPQQCACQYFGRCEQQDWAEPPELLPLVVGVEE